MSRNLVEKGAADLALSRHVEGLKNCHQELLSKEPYVCVCSPTFPLAALKKAITPEEFGKNYLVMRQRGSRMRSKIEEWFGSVGASEFLSAPLIEVNSLESSKHLIQSGIGMAAFPLVAVKEEIKQEKLLSPVVDVPLCCWFLTWELTTGDSFLMSDGRWMLPIFLPLED